MAKSTRHGEDSYRPPSKGPRARALRFVGLALAWVALALLPLAGRLAGFPLPDRLSFGTAGLALHGLILLAGLGVIALAHGLARRNEALRGRLEETQARAEREVQELSAGLGEWVWESDASGRFTFCGPAVTSVLGFGAEVVRGSRIEDLAETGDAERVAQIHERARRSAEAFRELDAWCLTRQGERVCIRFDGAPLLDSVGLMLGFRGVAREVTEQRRAQQELSRTHALLEAARAETKRLAGRAGAANRTQSDFVSRMSHELRTPLHGMLGLTEELLESPLQAGQRTCVIELRESATRLARLVGDVLDLAKLEAGQALLDVAPFEIARVARAAVDEHRAAADAKQLSLELQIDEGLPVQLRGDATRVGQMMGHVIGNAVKFTDAGRVEVRLAALESEGEMLRVLFAVRDTGRGIPREMQCRILEPFGIVDTSGSRRQEGSGLGLSLVARFAEAMGGRLGIESEAGEGTRLWFTLRFGAVEDENPHSGKIAPDEHRFRVLCVDDNRINARVAAKAVERLGHEAVTALSGPEALATMETMPFDMVLTDVQMPGMDGPQLAQAIRAGGAGHSGVPIVALTAHGTRDDRDRCLSAGMNAYLVKPLDVEALRAAISRLVLVPAPHET